MQLNKKAFKSLLNSEFNGNFNKMSRELDVNVAQLYRILEKDSNPGVKFLSKIITWCNQHDKNYNDYIFLA